LRYDPRKRRQRAPYCAACASEIQKAYARAHLEYKQEGLRRVKKWAKKVGYQHDKRRKRYAPLGEKYISRREWNIIREAFGFACAYCREPATRLQKDHFVPLSSGGEHSWRNIVPACPRCNNTKNARPPGEWVRDEESFQLIMHTIAQVAERMSRLRRRRDTRH